jgi:predicted transposase/invertase (TIGR01784 family)
MYALKNMNDWNRMPDALKEQVFKYLDQLAAVANLSEENRIAYDKAVDRYRVSRIVEEDIRREATEEGLKEGREKGRLSNALKMKAKGLDYETISDITGLSIQEIEKLGIDDRRDEGKL